MATNGYILVKDKDGKMKYLKDGKYYSPDEVRVATKAQAPQVQTVERKQELKPIYSFDSSKKTMPPPAAIKPVSPSVSDRSSRDGSLGGSIAPEEAKPLAEVKPIVPKEAKPTAVPVKKTQPDFAAVEEFSLADLKKTVVVPAVPPAKPLMAKEKVKFELEDVAPQAESQQQRMNDQKLIDEMVNNVIQRLKIKFSDPMIESRFRAVLVTYFRGVRHAKEVGYLLGLPKMSGGLELPKDKIVVILTVLEQVAQDFHKARRGVAAKPFDVSMMQQAEDVAHQLSAPVPVNVEPKSVPEKLLATKPNIPDIVKKATAPSGAARPAYVGKPAYVSRPEVLRPVAAAQAAIMAKQAKPQIHDIKVDRRLVGPVEELGIMDLTNLRQLGKTAEEMQGQLKKKFDFLSEQALVKKVESVQAWKKSPVFHLYIAMTYEGLRERKPIVEVIRSRQIANTECLTLSEYEMIGRLNADIAL